MRWSKKLRTTRSAKRKMPVVFKARTRIPSCGKTPPERGHKDEAATARRALLPYPSVGSTLTSSSYPTDRTKPRRPDPLTAGQHFRHSVVRWCAGRPAASFGVRPGDGPKGGPLLRSAEDPDRVARLEHQVCPGVRDHLLSAHYGQDGRPRLAPHREITYGATGEGTTLALVCFGDLSLRKSYPIYFDRL